jgi:two-component system CheB/CheR fusion protein
MIPESLKEKEFAILNKLISTEVWEPYRTQRLAKDGQIVEVWLTATPLVNETGEVYAIATTEREITSKNTKTGIYD